MSDTVSIKVEQAHSCGHIFEQIVYMLPDEAFSLNLTGARFDLTPDLSRVFPQTTITVSGHYSKVEVNGIEHRDSHFFCKGCGATLSLWVEGKA